MMPEPSNRPSAASIGHAPISGGRGGQNGRPRRQVGQELPQPSVVRPEIVAPIGDAMSLVAHQRKGLTAQGIENPTSKPLVGQSLRGDQYEIDLTIVNLGFDRIPRVDIR